MIRAKMLHSFNLSFLLALACCWMVVLGDDYDFDPKLQTCRRYGHQSAIIGNRLYIDGGEVLVSPRDRDQPDHNATNTRLLFHDLSVLSDQNMPPLETNLSKPAEVPSVSGGTLWPDVANGKIYLYGGEYTSGFTADFALWTYDAYNDVWNKSLADSWVKRAFRGASTVVEATGMGYYFGGWLGNSSVPGWRAKNGSIRPNLALNTLLAYDFIGNQWTNKSGPDDGLGRAEGVMFYIPKGDTGLLVHFGGVHVPNGDPALAVPAPMNTIDVYDLSAQTWYVQNTTGDIPGERRRFCASIVSAPDQSSFDIYVYAGLGFPDSTGFGDLYILSLPSFTWVKVLEPSKKYLHMSHYDATCNIFGDSQMLITGQRAGEYPQTCDVREVAAIHSLDLGKQNTDKAYWYHFRPNLTGYQVPSELSQAIGGSPSGAATKTRPDLDYGDKNLKVLFDRTVAATSRAPTRSVPPEFGGPGASSSSSSSSSGVSTGKMVAIIVPSVAGGFMILGAIFFFLHRRNNLRAAQRNVARLGQNDPGSPGCPPAYTSGVPPFSPAELYQDVPVHARYSTPVQKQDGNSAAAMQNAGRRYYPEVAEAAGHEAAVEMPTTR